jgi:adenosylcobinamide kinase/adenosylcobinamide-phosphate guanylyltransferase
MSDLESSARRVVLIGGGVRCGKSRLALELGMALGHQRALVATAQAFDEEMRERIARHRHERGDSFSTVEEPYDLIATLERLAPCDVVVVDCLTLWQSNLLLRGDDDAQILRATADLVDAIGRLPFHLLLVTNEVGMGIVPESRLGRRFRDLAGMLHQRLIPLATHIFFGVLGVMIRLRPAPVDIHLRGALL